MSARAVTGANAVLLSNGQKVGWATGVSWNESVAQVPVAVLGDVDVQEHEAVSRTVSISADMVYLPTLTLEQQGIWPEGGTTEVINFPELTFQIYSSQAGGADGGPIARFDGVKGSVRNWTVSNGVVATQNAQFVARRKVVTSYTGG